MAASSASSSSSSASDDESKDSDTDGEHGHDHEHGTRATGAHATSSIHRGFYRALPLYLDAANTGCATTLKVRLRGLGTLRNGGIFVAASSIRGAGRGLFTGRAFVKDSFVCLFGGSVIWAQEARRASEPVHHAREAGNGYLMDGGAMAALFKPATLEWCERERRKSPAQRRKLLPLSATGRFSSSPCSPRSSPSLSFLPSLLAFSLSSPPSSLLPVVSARTLRRMIDGWLLLLSVDPVLVEQAMDGGAGFMGNTAAAREQNVRILYLDPIGGAWPSYPRVMALQAKFDLPPNTEVLQPYNIPGSTSNGTANSANGIDLACMPACLPALCPEFLSPSCSADC
jgi:hypothetical protein